MYFIGTSAHTAAGNKTLRHCEFFSGCDDLRAFYESRISLWHRTPGSHPLPLISLGFFPRRQSGGNQHTAREADDVGTRGVVASEADRPLFLRG